MGGFAFEVACLRLVANEPLFGVYAVPVDWPVLRHNRRVLRSPPGVQFLGHEGL